jgi:hypothetical protein
MAGEAPNEGLKSSDFFFLRNRAFFGLSETRGRAKGTPFLCFINVIFRLSAVGALRFQPSRSWPTYAHSSASSSQQP